MDKLIKKECYIAYFDILGVGMATERDEALVFKSVARFRQNFDYILKNLKFNLDGGVKKIDLRKNIKHICFSDSIIAFTQDDSLLCLYSLLISFSQLFAESWSSYLTKDKNDLDYPIPLRGAMGYGNLLIDIDQNIVVGKALVESVKLADASQWMGIILTDKIADKMKHYKELHSYGERHEKRYSVNMKKGNKIKQEEVWVLNWPVIFKHAFTSLNVWDYNAQRIYQPFSYLFGNYQDLPSLVKDKYRNTRNFITHTLGMK